MDIGHSHRIASDKSMIQIITVIILIAAVFGAILALSVHPDPSARQKPLAMAMGPELHQ